MSTPQLIIIIVVACVAGGLSVSILGTDHSSWWMDFVVAVIGAYLLDWIGRQMSFPYIVPIPYNNVQYEFIWALLGSFLFIFLVRFASSRDH